MHWQIDDNKPIHSQLVEELINRILTFKYSPGEKIPSVRELAKEAKVNPNTMQKALVELEERGFILAKSTSGNYVTDNGRLINTAKQSLADAVVDKFIEDMKGLDFEAEEIITRLRKELSK